MRTLKEITKAASKRETMKKFVGMQVKAAIRFKRAGDFKNMDHSLNVAIDTCTNELGLNMDEAIGVVNTMLLVAGEK